MNNKEFEKVELYEHNADSYRKIKRAYDNGENVVGIVHATGTGKTYNAIQLAYDNKDKKIVYVVPSNGIIEHIKKVIEDNPNLNLKRDFPNLEFRTYQSFISLSKEEIASIDCDLLILDEFHHIGAPIWGARINTMLETHPEMKIFGITAYTIRDRGTLYERDMANPDTGELFSNKIVSRYDLCDAMIDGVLPKPIYKSAYANLIDLESKLEEMVKKLDVSYKEYHEYMKILSDVKKRIHEAPSIPNILRKSIKPNGKYIYFCPPCREDATNDIETIKKQALEWFKQFIREEDIVLYTSTSEMGELGQLNREAFYNDVTLDGKKADNKLRVMFAINQYNEGIHAPNIDGVIMGRGTASDIVYFEQLGRALSVRGNTKEKFDELEKASKEELIQMCVSRELLFKENSTKEELIEMLIAPVVIDLANNYEFIKELENNLRDRIKELKKCGLGNHLDTKTRDASFDIEMENQDLFEMLSYVRDRMIMSWDDYYELAKTYYEYYGDLIIHIDFKTINGYEYNENGVKLGFWLSKQRANFDTMPIARKRKLEQIGIALNFNDYNWQKMYELTKTYYEHYGNLNIPTKFKTLNGYEFDENGLKLVSWIYVQRKRYDKLTDDRKKLLNQIGFVLNINYFNWQKMYELAKTYYEHYGNSNISQKFKTLNGYEFDENGLKLGNWICEQRKRFDKLTDDKKQLLEQIGFALNVSDYNWKKMYKFAQIYYEYYGNLNISIEFKTLNGHEFAENGLQLGNWIYEQRKKFDELTDDKKLLLEQIGFILNVKDYKWQKMYELARTYFEHYGNSNIPLEFKTLNGYEMDENGLNLGSWLSVQRYKYNSLREERKEKLLKINFVVNPYNEQWQKMYELAKAYYEYHGNLNVAFSFKTLNGYEFDENGLNLGVWIYLQRKKCANLKEDKITKLLSIGMIWETKKNREEIKNICNQYNIDYNPNKNILANISVLELQSKIDFLNTHNMPLVNEQGLLIDIFSMCNIDMNEKYGISLEELIDEYYIKNKKKEEA